MKTLNVVFVNVSQTGGSGFGHTVSVAASQAVDPDYGICCCLSGQTGGSEQCGVSAAVFPVMGQKVQNVLICFCLNIVGQRLRT